MKIKSILDIKPDKNNANKGTKRGRGMVESSLRETGAGRSIVVDKDGRVIAGNKTLETWADIANPEDVVIVPTDGKKLVVVQRQDLDLSDDTGLARKLAYYDNRSSQVGLEWDTSEILGSMNAGLDLSFVFDQPELDDLMGDFLNQQDSADVEPQIDKAEELRVKWDVQLGQLWRLPSRDGKGEHRLICGDCTDRAVVDRVMGGKMADCVVTDPPYGVGVEYDGFDDTAENVKALVDGFMPIVSKMTPVALTPGIPAMWHYPRPDWLLAWIHPAATSSGPWGFIGVNPILVYGADPYLKAGKGRRHGHVVMVADRGEEKIHPVTKPLSVWEWLVERMSVYSGEMVFDPFAGSGTTLIACENLSRYCRAVEISPGYVAVALQRYADAFGVQPELI